MQTGNSDLAAQILDRARWAPSGDNTQPWRFEIAAPDHIVIHGFDTRSDCVYDLEGHASHLAHGTLIQSIEYAASEHGCRTAWQRRSGSSDLNPLYDIKLEESADISAHPLAEWISKRATQRRPMSPRQLSTEEKGALEEAVGPNFSIKWLATGLFERIRFGKFLFQAARLRLLTPEAFEVHRRIIEWGAKESKDKIPETAVGLSPPTLKISKWTFESWNRMAFMNGIPGATWGPRIELDFLPGVFCAAHYALIANKNPETVEDYVKAGMAVQRLWLTAASLNIQHQPEMTPLIFRYYVQNTIQFTENTKARVAANALNNHPVWQLFSADEADRACWMGRLGKRRVATRSIRLDLDDLMQK